MLAQWLYIAGKANSYTCKSVMMNYQDNVIEKNYKSLYFGSVAYLGIYRQPTAAATTVLAL